MTVRRAVLLALVASAEADVYMQFPPGSNNRLDEGGGNRNNNNRLMDTQNNAKGGYGYGDWRRNANNPAEPMTYVAGSRLPMKWALASHRSCGSENAECQIVIQYTCSSSTAQQSPPGVPLATGPGEGPIRDGTNGNTPDPNHPDTTRGLHEPTSFYQACDNRERNQGLYTADQNLNTAKDARRTRQNPNGARSGLECPEERDYYPYWSPTPWKDAMIMTNNFALCSWYRENSQNVKARGYCTGATTEQNLVPNNQPQCTQLRGTWVTVPAFGIAPPECTAAHFQRDNHLGQEMMANLTIPFNATGTGVDDAAACVYRLRYNITTGDTRACENPQYTTKTACEAAGHIWSAMYLDSTHNSTTLQSTPLDPLAIDTAQYGRTFEDRSHVIDVKGKGGDIAKTSRATEYDYQALLRGQTLVKGKL